MYLTEIHNNAWTCEAVQTRSLVFFAKKQPKIYYFAMFILPWIIGTVWRLKIKT